MLVAVGMMQIEDVPENWQATVMSYLGRHVLELAVGVANCRTQDGRRAMIAEAPESIRGMVEAEARRIYLARQKRRQ